MYDEVHITKPLTSRPANSEKYIVCKGFKGIDENYLQKLYIIVNSWDYIEENNMNLLGVFDNINSNYFDKVKMYNTKYFNIQISSIESTLEYINNKCDKEKKNK